MELFRALGTLIESPTASHGRVAAVLGLPEAPSAAEHGWVVARRRYPYASVYLGAEGMLGGEARDRIAGFRRALGLEGGGGAGGDGGQDSGADVGGREPDHLASLLGLLAALERWRREESDPARRALLSQARVTLAWEHLASWTGPYLASFEGCGVAFYEAWAALAADALARLHEEIESPEYLPAALRAAPGFADPRRDGGAAFVASLLAPVRSGVILLRDDLVRLGDDTGLACRAGERRYVLNAFLAQDPGVTLNWLAGHAARWSRRVVAAGPAPIAAWWAERAGNTAVVLGELAGEARPGFARGALDPAAAGPGAHRDHPASPAAAP